MGNLANILIAAGIFLALGLLWGMVKAVLAERRSVRDLAREQTEIRMAARTLAAEPGSRFSEAAWNDALFELYRAGLSLDESLALFRRLKVFWKD